MPKAIGITSNRNHSFTLNRETYMAITWLRFEQRNLCCLVNRYMLCLHCLHLALGEFCKSILTKSDQMLGTRTKKVYNHPAVVSSATYNRDNRLGYQALTVKSRSHISNLTATTHLLYKNWGRRVLLVLKRSRFCSGPKQKSVNFKLKWYVLHIYLKFKIKNRCLYLIKGMK